MSVIHSYRLREFRVSQWTFWTPHQFSSFRCTQLYLYYYPKITSATDTQISYLFFSTSRLSTLDTFSNSTPSHTHTPSWYFCRSYHFHSVYTITFWVIGVLHFQMHVSCCECSCIPKLIVSKLATRNWNEVKLALKIDRWLNCKFRALFVFPSFSFLCVRRQCNPCIGAMFIHFFRHTLVQVLHIVDNTVSSQTF